MTKQDRMELRDMKRSVNSLKSDLIKIASGVEQVSRPEAERLRSIIGRLEFWQHSGAGAAS